MDSSPRRSVQQLPAQHGHRVTAEVSPVALETHPHGAAPRRCLIPDQLLLTQAGCPERTEGAVRGAGDRVFRYAGTRGKEPGDEVIGWIGRLGCNDDTRVPSRASAPRSGASERT